MYKFSCRFSKISWFSGQALEKGIKLKNAISIQTAQSDRLDFFSFKENACSNHAENVF